MKTVENTCVGRFDVAWGLSEPTRLLDALVADDRDGVQASVRLADPRHAGEMKELQVYLDTKSRRPVLVGEITPGVWAVGRLAEPAR